MNFNDWWNGPSGFGNFTIKELKEMNGSPSLYKEYVEDLEESFYAGKPKPSTDFTIPLNNPGKDYLLYEKTEKQWVVGFYDKAWDQFICVDVVNGGEIFFRPSHWLPMPDAPDT